MTVPHLCDTNMSIFCLISLLSGVGFGMASVLCQTSSFLLVYRLQYAGGPAKFQKEERILKRAKAQISKEGVRLLCLLWWLKHFVKISLTKNYSGDNFYVGLVRFTHYQEIYDIMITRYKTKLVFHLFKEMYWEMILKYWILW